MKTAKKIELGAEPKKIAILGVLVAVAGYLVYQNFFAEPPEVVERPRPAAAKPVRGAISKITKAEQEAGLAGEGEAEASVGANKVIPGRRAQGEFRPTMKPRKGAQDPSKLDPALRLDLLARLQKVELSGAGRSLFDFSTTPAAAKPKQPEPKIAVKPEPKVQGPELPPPPPPPPVKPPPPPIPLKFYGSSLPVRDGLKRVFCMQNDEIYTPSEGDVIMKKYKIVRITPANVIVEDLDNKNQQTLPIEEVPKSG